MAVLGNNSKLVAVEVPIPDPVAVLIAMRIRVAEELPKADVAPVLGAICKPTAFPAVAPTPEPVAVLGNNSMDVAVLDPVPEPVAVLITNSN